MICKFVLTLYKISPFINKKLLMKILQMLSEMFCVFQKKSFIKKSVEQSKIKSVKNFMIKKVSDESFLSMYK